MTTLLAVGLICGLLLLFVTLTVVLRLIERTFPAFSEWMDARFGRDDGRGW